MSKKYLLIDPCYLGYVELAKHYGNPIATFHTGDGVFGFEGQKVSVDSGVICAYEVPDTESLHLQGDLAACPYAEFAYLDRCPTQREVNRAIGYYLNSQE